MAINGITKHAHHRCQKRSIPVQMIELLEEYGATQRSRGADVYYLDKAAKARLARDFGADYRLIERWIRVYIVVADSGAIVTAGHRTKRITRH